MVWTRSHSLSLGLPYHPLTLATHCPKLHRQSYYLIALCSGSWQKMRENLPHEGIPLHHNSTLTILLKYKISTFPRIIQAFFIIFSPNPPLSPIPPPISTQIQPSPSPLPNNTKISRRFLSDLFLILWSWRFHRLILHTNHVIEQTNQSVWLSGGC